MSDSNGNFIEKIVAKVINIREFLCPIRMEIL